MTMIYVGNASWSESGVSVNVSVGGNAVSVGKVVGVISGVGTGVGV